MDGNETIKMRIEPKQRVNVPTSKDSVSSRGGLLFAPLKRPTGRGNDQKRYIKADGLALMVAYVCFVYTLIYTDKYVYIYIHICLCTYTHRCACRMLAFGISMRNIMIIMILVIGIIVVITITMIIDRKSVV